MAIPDLLWACPACGKDRGLARDDAVCTGCGTRFARGPGALIEATGADGKVTTGSASEWLARLPGPESLLENDPVRTATVRIRTASGEARVHGEGGYLNRVEVLDDPVVGELRLERDRLVVLREGEEEVWPLESLSAVQASSRSLQLKRRDRPLVAFYFDDDAIYLWERLLRAALRAFYRRTGRGEILEFQPRIATARSSAGGG